MENEISIDEQVSIIYSIASKEGTELGESLQNLCDAIDALNGAIRYMECPVIYNCRDTILSEAKKCAFDIIEWILDNQDWYDYDQFFDNEVEYATSKPKLTLEKWCNYTGNDLSQYEQKFDKKEINKKLHNTLTPQEIKYLELMFLIGDVHL